MDHIELQSDDLALYEGPTTRGIYAWLVLTAPLGLLRETRVTVHSSDGRVASIVRPARTDAISR